MRGLTAHFLQRIANNLNNSIFPLIGQIVSSSSRQKLENIHKNLLDYYFQLRDDSRPVSQETLDNIRDYLLNNKIGLGRVRQNPSSPGNYYLNRGPITGNITPYLNWFENNPCNRRPRNPKNSRQSRNRGQR